MNLKSAIREQREAVKDMIDNYQQFDTLSGQLTTAESIKPRKVTDKPCPICAAMIENEEKMTKHIKENHANGWGEYKGIDLKKLAVKLLLAGLTIPAVIFVLAKMLGSSQSAEERARQMADEAWQETMARRREH
jgi:hypothetical protein